MKNISYFKESRWFCSPVWAESWKSEIWRSFCQWCHNHQSCGKMESTAGFNVSERCRNSLGRSSNCSWKVVYDTEKSSVHVRDSGVISVRHRFRMRHRITISGCDTALGCHQTWPSGQVRPAPRLTASSHCIVVPHRLTVLSYASSYTSSLYRIVVHRYRTTVPIIVPHRRTASSHRIVAPYCRTHCRTTLSYGIVVLRLAG